MTTLSELRTLTRRITGVNLTELWSNSELDGAINRAYVKLYSLAEWQPWVSTDTVSTVASTATVTIPSGHNRVLAVAHDDDGNPLLQRTQQDIARIPSARKTNGKPLAWAVLTDTTLLLHPTPDDAYTLDVTCVDDIVLLSADGDRPAWDADHLDDVLAYMASYEVLEVEGDDPDRIQWCIEQANQRIAGLARHYLPSGQAVELPPHAPSFTGRGMQMIPPTQGTAPGGDQ